MVERPSRKRLRYPGHDYRAPCCVHVTICTWNRQRLFGSVTDGVMRLNSAGVFVDEMLRSLHSDDAGIAIDPHIVMPDHIHAIITLGTNPNVATEGTVSDVVQRFKMRVMRSWRAGVQVHGWPRYDTQLWQRSYHDALIESDRHYERTRDYILANPARWMEKHHPE